MKKALCFALSIIVIVAACISSAYALSGGLLIQSNRVKAINGEPTTPSPDDIFVKDVVFYFCKSIGAATYNEVKNYLDEKEYKYDATLGNDYANCRISMDLEEGSITLIFFPLDASENSTAFGNPNREYLSLIQYDRGENWFSITDLLHMSPCTMQAVYRKRGNNSFEFDRVSDMVNFYNYNLGGSITVNDDDIATIYTASDAGDNAGEKSISIKSPFIVPPGEYIVGDDIPAGIYRLEISDPKKSAIILVNEPGDYGRTVLYATLGKYGGSNNVGRIELKNGYLLYVYSSEILFHEYTGLLK